MAKVINVVVDSAAHKMKAKNKRKYNLYLKNNNIVSMVKIFDMNVKLYKRPWMSAICGHVYSVNKPTSEHESS